MPLQTVTIVGRVNVGKSTLFNRLLEKRKALTSDIPGTTRDLNTGLVNWNGTAFKLVDSGGLVSLDLDQSQNINNLITKKAIEALEKSEVVLFIVDAQAGINVQDRLIAKFLKKYSTQIIVVANKCDDPQTALTIFEFKKLGLGDPIAVSAINGSGTGDLLDLIVVQMKDCQGEIQDNSHENLSQLAKICLIGKPNVGKSTLLNKILGEEKVIVSPVPHTTREPHDEIIDLSGEKVVIIDTVGVRKKRNIPKESLEKIGVSLTFQALKKADLAILVLDASQSLTDQDLKLGQLINADRLSVIIVGNKWDLYQADKKNRDDEEKKDASKKIIQYFNKSFPHLNYAPVVFISALSGKNLNKLSSMITTVLAARKLVISDNALDKLLKKIIKKYSAPRFRNLKGRVKKTYIKSLVQKDTNPPVFALNISADQKLVPAYLSYVKKELYEKFGFTGTPLKIVVEKTKNNN